MIGSRKKMLITGANGMLGSSLVKFFENSYDVYATGSNKTGHSSFQRYKCFDLLESSYSDLIDWSSPDVIIHCAALTNGNYCEKNILEAYVVNGISVQRFLSVIDNEVEFIYISTDAVYPSSIHLAKESDYPGPESIYGKSKDLGEYFLLNSKDALFSIIRTTIVGYNLNSGRESFCEWIINAAQSREAITLFSDVLFTPISIWSLANNIELIISSGKHGLYNIGGSEICSKYDFAIKLLEELDLPTTMIRKGYIKDFKDRAKRSTDQTLCSKKFESIFNVYLPDLKTTINKLYLNYEK